MSEKTDLVAGGSDGKSSGSGGKRNEFSVRALEGTYGELMSELFNQPRVYRTPDMKWKGGPQNYGKKVINPQAAKVAQSIETHIDVYAPGGYGQKHGHMNSAVFFVLKGKGTTFMMAAGLTGKPETH